MNKLASRLEELGLELQPNKTELMEFSSYGRIDKNMYIIINNSRITCKKKQQNFWESGLIVNYNLINRFRK